MKKTIDDAVKTLVALLLSGTILFKFLENWSWIDAFYFTGSTMLTIGYGDLVPTTPISKLLTIVYSLLSIGIALYALNIISQHQFHTHHVHRPRPVKEDAAEAIKTIAGIEHKIEKEQKELEEEEKQLRSALKAVRKKMKQRKK